MACDNDLMMILSGGILFGSPCIEQIFSLCGKLKENILAALALRHEL